MPVSVDDLRSEISGYNWDVLTEGDDSVAQRSIEKAVVWAKAKIMQARGLWNDEDEILRLVVIKRALYELYSHAENEEVARDKKEDAMELLKAYFGNSVDTTGYSSGGSQVPLAVGAIRHADDSYKESKIC